MTSKDLKLSPIDLKVDGGILIDSINVNGIEWQYMKTVEETFELGQAIMHYRKGSIAQEHLCQEIGDMFLQIGIMTHLVDKSMIQSLINKKLIAINNKNIKTIDKEARFNTIGFKP